MAKPVDRNGSNVQINEQQLTVSLAAGNRDFRARRQGYKQLTRELGGVGSFARLRPPPRLQANCFWRDKPLHHVLLWAGSR